ncbi:MAG: DUF975 domain-containing protein [Nostoc sp.]|uniref:DUF975 domain-containing protein n=1 Tax=unclassified Nostoc TaxID=2593658 RepID=UPI001DD48E05|nr:DUF975 domain-containing protein [Nostoc sp. JL34]MBN3881696.1 DUF975 domain-containing protein [Nostoc sp. JL34]
MFENFGSPGQIQPLSLGNVVTAGFRIYRSHLKSYFLLALIGYLWSLLPFLFFIPAGIALFWNLRFNNNSLLLWLIVLLIGIIVYFYALGKYLVNAAIISRLAFGELVNQPETVNTARSQVKPRLWMFVLTVLLLLLISFLLLLFFVISLSLLQTLQWIKPLDLILPLLNIGWGFIVLAAIFWFVARFFIADVLIGIEEHLNPITTISRSWELSKGNALRIILILSVSLLITMPIQIVIQLVVRGFIQALNQPILIQQAIPDIMNGSTNAIFFIAIVYLFVLGSLFLVSAVILPFWQAIKAVIYYDLRSRREGLGLKLRDREI